MDLADRQHRMIEDLLLIEDAQERLAAIVDRGRSRPPLGAAERTEANRVAGCISAAWVTVEWQDGRASFRGDADSPLVRGLVLLLCDLHSGAGAAEVLASATDCVARLGLDRQLSPTRLNGLRSVQARLRALAAAAG